MRATDLPDGRSLENAPRIWGKYRLTHRADTGGGNIIYQGVEVKTARRVAVEVFIKPAAEDRFDERLAAAVGAFGRVKHAGLVEIYEHGITQDGARFVSMELLPGQTLAAYLQLRERVAPGEAVDMAAGVADALNALHEAGFVYEALEPSRVMLERRPSGVVRVKLLLGVGRRPSRASTDRRADRASPAPRSGTYPAVVDGSPAYLSPEQIAGEPLDARSDVYALGAMVYELICGVPPFGREPVDVVVSRHLNEALAAPSARVPGVPECVDHALGRALRKSKAERQGSTLELLAELASGVVHALSDPIKFVGRKVLGRYRLDAPLRTHEHGAAFAARDLETDSAVDVELFTVPNDLREELYERVSMAAKLAGVDETLLAPLDHGLGDDGTWLVVTEPCFAETLAERIARTGRLDPFEVAPIMVRLARSIDAMHAEGLIHRDLDPRHVYLPPPGATISGMRLRLVTPPVRQSEALVPRGEGVEQPACAPFGSPAYLSPEEATSGWLGVRSNVYSLGAIAYEMLVGSPPFAAATAAELIAQHIAEPPPPPSIRAPGAGIPRELEAVLFRTLAKRPADRYMSAGDLAVELVAALGAAQAVAVEAPAVPLVLPLVRTSAGAADAMANLAVPLVRPAVEPEAAPVPLVRTLSEAPKPAAVAANEEWHPREREFSIAVPLVHVRRPEPRIDSSDPNQELDDEPIERRSLRRKVLTVVVVLIVLAAAGFAVVAYLHS